jgi:hypothetical protein
MLHNVVQGGGIGIHAGEPEAAACRAERDADETEREGCGARSELLMTMMQCEKRTEEYLGDGRREAAKGREPGR